MLTLLGAAASIVNDAVKLFTCQPVVTIVPRCTLAPIGVLLMMALSDIQVVMTVFVLDTRIMLL